MLWLLAACRPGTGELALHVPREHLAVFQDFAAWSGHPDIRVDDGEPHGGGVHVVVAEEPSLGRDTYRIEADRRAVTVEGGDLLGMQHGLADAFERMGFRFFHPHATHAPAAFDDLRDAKGLGETVSATAVRNGLHLHTLHPIEGELDFWERSDDGLERAKRTIDWVAKNRGTHVEWVALDDIVSYPLLAEDWQAHTGALVDYAHARGLTVGLGTQLFGSGNLQLAFDLVDGDWDQAEVDARLRLLGSVGPDLFHFSFGEFSAEDPEAFVTYGNDAVASMRAAVPGVDVATVIHVGNYDDLRIEYQGEEMLYYFLAQYVDATPWVHTVMYYDLFEDAGGAYLHDDFSEHRDFLLERLAAGEPVAYYPESAYWVAFDVNVPTYLPLYMRSRWTDLDRIRDVGPALTDHTVFSSGWEWGYWQTDYLTLRMAARTPEDWKDGLREMWAPWGDDGRALADGIGALADLQHDTLIGQRLAAYLAGREAIIDLGDSQGIVSQPDRPQLHEIVQGDAALRSEVASVVEQLHALAVATDAIGLELEGLGGTDPWFEEVRDGVAVDALRARFAATVFGGALALASGADGRPAVEEAERLIDEARAVVAKRHAALHWAGGDALLQQSLENATLYDFGYLAKADSLCFWDRERVQLSNLVNAAAESVPPCT